MGVRGPAARGCSYPGCGAKVTYDLVLSERYNIVRRWGDSSRVQTCRTVTDHLYLCEAHGKQFHELMQVYEGKE